MKKPSVEISAKIELLAKKCIRSAVPALEFSRNDRNALMAEIERGLIPSVDGELRKAYSEMCFLFAGNSSSDKSDQYVAKVWLWKEVIKAAERITLDRYIKNEFEDSRLFEKFPELRDACDKSGLLPASLFQPISSQSALGYKGHAVVLSEAIPYELKQAIVKFVKSKSVSGLRVRLSHYDCGLLSEHTDHMQKATIYGPSFANRFVKERLYKANQATVLKRIPINQDEEFQFKALEPIERFEM